VVTVNTTPMAEPGAGHGSDQRPPSVLTRLLLAAIIVVFTVFWTWALFFASKEAVNKIDDRAWADRAEQICQSATTERLALADFRIITEGGPELIQERADIVEESTDILRAMLDDVVAAPPTDQKGLEIVPLWEDDYRTYLEDRYRYARQLRESGENLPFYETADGIPITERIETFAGDNEMPACAPPRDLTR
jgi:hypothetical protein